MELDRNIIFLILVIALIGIGAYLYVNSPDLGNSVSVQGSSEIKTRPDFVSVYFSIETLKNNAKDSQSENNKISSDVVDSLEDLGFDREEIETISFNVYEDFDYTNNVQGGRTGGTAAPVTVVAQGLPLAEWVSVTSTITQATGISITVTANDERNYSNP
ncbi:MAG: SIMPL domain-containing protein [Nanoarchaeota archaeon]